MSIVEKSDWAKLHIAKINDWTLGLCGDQHVLGWVILFPPRKIEGSLTGLTDEELIMMKQVGKIAEDLLTETFQAEWFNYSQAGNVVRNLHIHLQPRYSSEREFQGFKFTDEGWGHPVKSLPRESLPSKEVVFEIVRLLRENLSKKTYNNVKIEILNS